MGNTKYCFSYVRFSSSKQKGNSSVDRQSIAERVATEQGWTYKPEWNAKNLGVSGFKGDNRKTLEAIVEARLKNKIPAKSVIILESLDRATRLTLDEAQQLIRKILLSGLEIYTDLNKRHLTKASLNNATDVMLTAVELDAAYQYSKRISNRSIGGIAKGVRIVRAGGKHYFGGFMPVYITGLQDGKWVIDQERLKVVKNIFKWFLNGWSMNKIAVQLTADTKAGKCVAGLKRRNDMPKVWARATVRSVLTNHDLTGTFTLNYTVEYDEDNKPKKDTLVLKNYLPEVVSQKDFDLVQERLKHNKTLKGAASSNKNVNNLFRGLCFCEDCKGIVGIASVNTYESGNTYTYLGCIGGSRHRTCHARKRVNRDIVEKVVFEKCLDMAPSQFFTEDNQGLLREREIISAQLVALDKRAAKIKVLLADDESDIGEVKAMAAEVKKERNELAEQLKQLEAKSNTLSVLPEQIQDFYKLLNDDLKNPEVRKKIMNVMPSVIKRIDFKLSDYLDFTVTLCNGEQWCYSTTVEEIGWDITKNGKLVELYTVNRPVGNVF